MNEELRPPPKTNPYVLSSNVRPTGTWIPDTSGLVVKLTVLTVSVFLIVMYLLGLPPATNSHNFVEKIPFTEAVRAAINADWTAYFSSRSNNQLLFELGLLTVCLIGLIGYLAAPKRLHGIALAFHGLAVGLVLALFAVSNPILILLVFMLMSPMALLNAVTGRAYGEDWQDTASFSAISTWVLMWIILLGMAWRRNRILARTKFIKKNDEA